MLQSQSGTQEFTSPYLDQFTLQTDSSVEAFQAALRHPLVSSVPEFRIALSRALRQRQPWSPTASHELAEALNAAGRTADATRQHTITRNLDQLELLAWRVFRPQAAIPEMALPLYLEISSRLQEVGAVDEAGKWLTATESLSPVPAVAMTEIAARRRTLEQALAARATDQSPQDTETTAALLAELPPIPVRRIPLSTPVPGDASGSPAVNSPDTDWQFVDVAAELGLNFSYHNGASEFRSIVETIGGGSAVVDFDGDDWPDVFLPQVQPGTDRLFRNLRGTRFEDSSTVSAVDGVGHGLAATAGDFDCDGFVDLCVTRLGSCRLLKNEGDGSFSDVTPSSLAARRGCSSGACFADLNQDGLPELFVLNYVEDWERRCVNSEGRYAVCDPRELRPAVNRLYRNLGDGEFEDITESSGLSAFPGRALGVIAADLTCDGRLDVFVANDGLPNSFLTFDATTFQLQNIAFVAGVAVPENGRAHAGMGAALADFNADAHPDLLVHKLLPGSQHAVSINRLRAVY
ncbi:MAG UNVERIFIED_CONTAM: VCBS repeat-containing protein [Planctomycetaceae bacterium]